MGNLYRTYHQDDSDDSLSLYARVNALATKHVLDPRYVLDRGLSSTNSRPQYLLRAEFLYRLESVVNEFQSFLTRASSLVPGRASCYQLDPQHLILPVLRGCYSLSELHAAWDVIRYRLEMGHHMFDKYVAEFKGEESPISPQSTAPGLYSPLRGMDSHEHRLHHVLRNVPHHYNTLTAETQEALDLGRPLQEALPAPTILTNAFPSRPVEKRPSVISYDSDGEKVEHHLLEGSSYRNDSWTIPDSYWQPEPKSKGKKKATFDPASIPLPPSETVEDLVDSSVSRAPATQQPTNSQSTWFPVYPQAGSLGPTTPFKSSGFGFFGSQGAQRTDNWPSGMFPGKSTQLQPNVLYGMGIPISASVPDKQGPTSPPRRIPPLAGV
jgi:hypothetical protein